MGGDKGQERDMDDGNGKWQPKNWKKKDERDLKKMAPQQRSKYMAYEDPPKDVADEIAATRKRLVELKKKKIQDSFDATEDDKIEKDKHEKLIGQLKAAEARNRIRIMRLRYEANRGQEINHLISCQPTARKAVRLQALLPVKHDDKSGGDRLDKISRARVESLLEDSAGLLTGRT